MVGANHGPAPSASAIVATQPLLASESVLDRCSRITSPSDRFVHVPGILRCQKQRWLTEPRVSDQNGDPVNSESTSYTKLWIWQPRPFPPLFYRPFVPEFDQSDCALLVRRERLGTRQAQL